MSLHSEGTPLLQLPCPAWILTWGAGDKLMAGVHLVVAGNLVLQAQVQVGYGVQQVVAHQLLSTFHAGPPGPEHARGCPVIAFGNVLRGTLGVCQDVVEQHGPPVCS